MFFTVRKTLEPKTNYLHLRVYGLIVSKQVHRIGAGESAHEHNSNMGGDQTDFVQSLLNSTGNYQGVDYDNIRYTPTSGMPNLFFCTLGAIYRILKKNSGFL